MLGDHEQLDASLALQGTFSGSDRGRAHRAMRTAPARAPVRIPDYQRSGARVAGT